MVAVGVSIVASADVSILQLITRAENTQVSKHTDLRKHSENHSDCWKKETL